MIQISKEEAMEILKLLSNLESVIDMNIFRREVPDWLSQRLEDVSNILVEKIKDNK